MAIRAECDGLTYPRICLLSPWYAYKKVSPSAMKVFGPAFIPTMAFPSRVVGATNDLPKNRRMDSRICVTDNLGRFVYSF
jgi:hypothetical protein